MLHVNLSNYTNTIILNRKYNQWSTTELKHTYACMYLYPGLMFRYSEIDLDLLEGLHLTTMYRRKRFKTSTKIIISAQ